LNEQKTHDNIVVGFLRTAAVCFLFHNTETNNDLYRDGIESNISCDYHKEEQHQNEVFKTNSADLKPPEIIEIAALQTNDDMVDLTTPAAVSRRSDNIKIIIIITDCTIVRPMTTPVTGTSSPMH
jgi:hypothetical protein